MNKEAFKNWMSNQYSSPQENYTMNAIQNYCACAERLETEKLLNKSIL